MAEPAEKKSGAPSQERASEKKSLFLLLTPSRLLLAVGSLLVLGALGAYALVPWQRPNKVSDDSAGSHWQQALQALVADDFSLAQTHLSHYLEVWPINAEAHFLMARTCRRAGDDAGWQRHLRKAEILLWSKEDVELERRLRQAQSGDLRGVEEGLLAIRSASPPAEQLLIFEALVKGYLETDRLADVLALTREWMERYPDQWQPNLFRGLVFQLGHSPDRAIAEFRRLLELKPDHARAHFELASALMLNSEFQEALEHFQTFLHRYPDDSDTLASVANCQFSLGQFEAAQATLGELFARQELHAAGFFIRAKLDLALDKPQEALQWLRRAEALAPHEVDILYNLVVTCQRLGKQQESKVYEQKLQDARRRFDHLEAIKKQILTESHSVSLRHEAGTLAVGLGRDEEAIHWLRSALHLDPTHRPTHKLLADYYEKRGDGLRAADHRRKGQGK